VAVTDRAARAAAADRFATALAAVVFAAAGVALVFAAIRFVAAAEGSGYSPWRAIGVPADHKGRIALLFLAFVVALLVLVAGLRRRDPLLRFEVQDGAVLVRASALEDSVRAELLADPDVLRVSPRVRLRDGQLKVEVEVAARPFADVARLRSLGMAGTRAALCDGAGLPAAEPQVHVEAVRARELRKYL
jgi:hypothetical protein